MDIKNDHGIFAVAILCLIIDAASALFRSVMYTGHHAHGRKGREQGGASIAEEGKRDADDRRNADAHADVHKGLERHERCHTETDKCAHGVAGLNADDHAADDDCSEQQDDNDAGNHAELLTDDAVDKVRVLAGEIIRLTLRSLI